VVVGGFEQIVLAKNLLAAFEDLVSRLDGLKLVACSPENIENTLFFIL